MRIEDWKRGEKYAFVLGVFFLLFYLWTQSTSIYGGDGGDLVSAAFSFGVAHPPGYPLYTFLGWMLTKIPLYTIAWRVGLLSSISGAITLGMLFTFLFRLTKNALSTLIAVATLGFSYLFWLYTAVPEVFALHILISIFLFYLGWIYQETGRLKNLYACSFLFGLSLTHHHTILLLVPAFLILVWKRIHVKPNFISLPKIIGLFFLGLIPYVYVVIAAHTNPLLNWEDPKTLAGFVRLVTRAMYGSFRSTALFNLSLTDRLYHISLLFHSIYLDFTKVGLVVGVIGMVSIFFRRRLLFWVTSTAFLFSGPLYLIYAGFPYENNFHLGTIERFYLVPYLFFVFWIAFGLVEVNTWGIRITKRFLRIPIKLNILFVLLPLVLLLTNFSKIYSLKYDRTAENLGQDILRSLPPRSILIVSDDVVTMNTEYVYLASGGKAKNEDKILLHWGFMDRPFYNSVYAHVYPELGISLPSKSGSIFKDLVLQNYPSRSIYSTIPLDLGSKYWWLPYGLVYKLVSDKIDHLDFLKENDALFANYQNPATGALAIYPHLLLSEVKNRYADAYREVASILGVAQLNDATERYLNRSLELNSDDLLSKHELSRLYLREGKCDQVTALLEPLSDTGQATVETYSLLTEVYKSCFHNETQTKYYQSLYEQKVKAVERPLQ